MRQEEHLTRTDVISQEEELLRIPGRQERLLAEIGTHRKVLDIGCGSGRLSRAILERLNEVWGLELNAEAAAHARDRGVRVVEADLEKGLPFLESSFDVVHAGHVLENVYDTSLFFSEVRRVLRPGGFFLFSVPNLNSLENRLRILRGQYLASAGACLEDAHGGRIRWFNLEKLRELCRLGGLRITQCDAFAPVVSSHPWVEQGLRYLVRRAPSLGSTLLIRAEPEI